MPSDRSRRTDRPRYGYTGVVAQQGRVILDRDFNAEQGMNASRVAADALDFVGPCGTPDNGFAISLPKQSSTPVGFWDPPVQPPPASPPFVPGGSLDFLIAPGTMYVGGERVAFYGEQGGAPIIYSYFDQPDWQAPPQPEPNASRELVYLDLTEQEVSAVEDPDLLEVALGGPDTTQRLKMLRRVARMAVPGSACAAAWDTAVKRWAESGWVFDPASMRLAPAARLMVGFTQDAGAGNPCDPVATGGYLGADNQLIRVRVAGSKAAPKVLWGYDNASFLYLVTSVDPTGTILTLASDPPDALHWPQTGQVVEILQTAAVLATEPDETQGGPQPLLRVAAETDGILRKLTQPYGPATPGSTGNAIVLDDALPPAVAQSTLPLFLRVWQAETKLTEGTAIALNDPVTSTSTGVTVTITLASGATPTQGAFWLIAVRPATPQGVYPESLLTSPQPPDGPRRWACPLAVIDWPNATVADCRSVFDNLVTLSRLKPGCCTVSISPQDVTAGMPLQALIDAAAAKAQNVTVCLAAGTYAVPRPLRLSGRHDGLTLESCGGTALLRAETAADRNLFADGLVVLAGVLGVTLRGLTLQPIPVAIEARLIDQLRDELAKARNSATGERAALQTLLRAPCTAFAIRAFNAPDLTLDCCTIIFEGPLADDASDLFAAAVFLQGDCAGMAVRGCDIGTLFTATYTPIDLGDQEKENVAPAAAEALDRAVDNMAANFEPGSPPVSTNFLLGHRLDTALDLLVTHRESEVYDPQRRAIIVTCGVVAAGHASLEPADDALIPCLLGAVSIRDTSFAGLTFATWFSATPTELRLTENRVTGGVAGLWLEVPDAATPRDVAKGTQKYYPDCLYFEEFLALYLYSMVLPPPSPQARLIALPGRLAATDCSLFVLGNQVDASATNTLGAGRAPALLLALDGLQLDNFAAATALSVIVASNHLRNKGGLPQPAALVTLPAHQPCAITGNIIENTGPGQSNPLTREALPPSLWVIVAQSVGGEDQDGESPISLLAVSGNVLRGQSDLQYLSRGDADRRLGWSPFNADPT